MENIDQNQAFSLNSQQAGLTPQYAEFNLDNKTTGNINPTGNPQLISKVKSELSNRKMNFLIEEIKKIIIDMVYYSEDRIKINFSDYLSEKLGFHYTYMANLFSKIHGNTIQHFIITTKIERVKELLIYEGLTLTEISFMLHYSSVAHLSNQFKKVEGVSPSQFLISKGKSPRSHSTGFSKVSYVYTKQSEQTENDPVILSLVPKETPKHYESGSLQMEG